MSEYKHMYELLDAVSNVKSAKAKAAFLKDNDCLAIRDFLKGSFDKSVTFNWIPKGSVPYTPKDELAEDITSLIDKTSVFNYFADEGPGIEVPSVRRERMFIELLESIHPKDAELVITMKDKKLAGKYKGLTSKLCNTVWGGLITK